MLHLETIEPHALSVLNQLMTIPELRDFSLVGGTALYLRYGHRKSVDLDLFSNKPFENSIIVRSLEKKIKVSFVSRSTNPHFGIFGFVGELKVDLIRHPHPLIRPELNNDSIRMFSTEDIIAMRVQAILGRGKKKFFGILQNSCNIIQSLILYNFIKRNMLLKIY